MPFNIGPGELVLVLAIALLVLGPGKLPDVGHALGKSIREFRRAASDVEDAATASATPARSEDTPNVVRSGPPLSSASRADEDSPLTSN